MATRKTKQTNKRKSTPARTQKPVASTPAPNPFVIGREEALRTGAIPVIPGHARTPAQLDAELAAMPVDFLRTTLPASLLRREAEELLVFKDDAAVFAARGAPVTAGHFALVANLMDLLPAERGAREESEAAYAGFDAKEDALAAAARAKVEQLQHLAALSNVSPALTVLGSSKSNLRLMDALAALDARVRPRLELFVMRADAQRLLDDIKQLREAMFELRAKQSGEGGTMMVTTERTHRIKRMLLDTLRFVAAAGRYVFPDDPARGPAYQLQHINAYRNASRGRGPTLDGGTPPPARGGTPG